MTKIATTYAISLAYALSEVNAIANQLDDHAIAEPLNFFTEGLSKPTLAVVECLGVPPSEYPGLFAARDPYPVDDPSPDILARMGYLSARTAWHLAKMLVYQYFLGLECQETWPFTDLNLAVEETLDLLVGMELCLDARQLSDLNVWPAPEVVEAYRKAHQEEQDN